jgi:hypothetical protein
MLPPAAKKPEAPPPLPGPGAPLPLDGVTILAVEPYGAGLFRSMLLADLGTEVIEIENLAEGGDISREVGPHFDGGGTSLLLPAFNRNECSTGLGVKPGRHGGPGRAGGPVLRLPAGAPPRLPRCHSGEEGGRPGVRGRYALRARVFQMCQT